MTDKVMVCPNCKGTGKVIKIDWLDAMFTLGLTILEDLNYPEKCPVCKGKGIIKL